MRNTSPFNGRSKPHIMARKIFTASIWDDPGKECQYAPLARRENDPAAGVPQSPYSLVDEPIDYEGLKRGKGSRRRRLVYRNQVSGHHESPRTPETKGANG